MKKPKTTKYRFASGGDLTADRSGKRLIEIKIVKTAEQSRYLLDLRNFNKTDEREELIEMKIVETAEQARCL